MCVCAFMYVRFRCIVCVNIPTNLSIFYNIYTFSVPVDKKKNIVKDECRLRTSRKDATIRDGTCVIPFLYILRNNELKSMRKIREEY